MRALLAALMVALVACTASAAPEPGPTATPVSTPTATAVDDELKKCVAAIVKELRSVRASEDARDQGILSGRRLLLSEQTASEKACAKYLE